MKEIFVHKRSGEKEPYNHEKIQRQIQFACEGITNVSQSMIEINMHLEIYDGITTAHIDKLAENSAVNLIRDPNGHVNYQDVAGRLKTSALRKEVYGSYTPPPLYEIIKKNVEVGLYEPNLLTWYTEMDWAMMDGMVDHSRDEKYTHAAISQLVDKYLIRNRSTGEIYETPQVRYIVAAATAMNSEPEKRMQFIKELYNHISLGDFSCATPPLAGLGSRTKQFSSCVLIKAGDSLPSIYAAGEMMGMYASKRAGIGFDFSSIRRAGAPIRGGEIKHTGLVPFIKKWFGDLRATSQGGIRNASATMFFPIWHHDYQELIVLKNNAGTDETRVRHLDYGVITCNFLWNRMKQKKSMTLFDPKEVPDLYAAFYSDQKSFVKLYEKYEKDATKTKITIDAGEVHRRALIERSDTSRIYLANIDNIIRGGSIDPIAHPIFQSNLCMEILIPTKSFERLEDVGYIEIENNSVIHRVPCNFTAVLKSGEKQLVRFLNDGDDVSVFLDLDHEVFLSLEMKIKIVERNAPAIALCTLASQNWGRFKTPQQMRKSCHAAVRFLNNILEYQDYLSVQSHLANEDFRPIGIGVTNLAYWHAKRGLKYGSPEALAEVKRWMEHMTFYCLEASVQLAKERGPCKQWKSTCYAKGRFIWEKRADAVNELTDFTPELDWEPLRAEMMEHGVRNALLTALPPVESSSVVLNSTNGIEVPKELISTKESKGSSLTQVVPEYEKLKKNYQTMFEVETLDYLKEVAVFAAYSDQAISANTWYDPGRYPKGRIPITLVTSNIMNSMRWGVKTFYYNITKKTGIKNQLTEIVNDDSIRNDADEAYCESCVL